MLDELVLLAREKTLVFVRRRTRATSRVEATRTINITATKAKPFPYGTARKQTSFLPPREKGTKGTGRGLRRCTRQAQLRDDGLPADVPVNKFNMDISFALRHSTHQAKLIIRGFGIFSPFSKKGKGRWDFGREKSAADVLRRRPSGSAADRGSGGVPSGSVGAGRRRGPAVWLRQLVSRADRVAAAAGVGPPHGAVRYVTRAVAPQCWLTRLALGAAGSARRVEWQ